MLCIVCAPAPSCLCPYTHLILFEIFSVKETCCTLIVFHLLPLLIIFIGNKCKVMLNNYIVTLQAKPSEKFRSSVTSLYQLLTSSQ